MSTANLDAYDLSQVPLDGEINEDVLQQLIRVNEWDNPILAMAGSRSTGNPYYSWTNRDYAAPILDNQRVDGADASGNDTRNGIRVGNHSQILDKVLRVSTRGRSVNTIGYADSLALQISERGTELMRDKEAQFASNNASVEATDTVAGVSAGIMAWLNNRNIQNDADTGVIASVASSNPSTDGGWVNRTGNTVPGRTYTGTVPGAVTEKALKDACQAIYLQGGNPDCLVTVPELQRKMSEYFFTSGARIGTLESKIPQESRSGATAMGRVNVWVSDFQILTLKSSRNMQVTDAATSSDSIMILDPSQLRTTTLTGLRVEALAKTGTADNRQMSWDGGFQVDCWAKCGAIVDVDRTADMVAG